jgi:hypothetical protein
MIMRVTPEERAERLEEACRAAKELASDAFDFADADDGVHEGELFAFTFEVFRRCDGELRAVVDQMLDTPDDVAPMEKGVLSREFMVSALSLAGAALAMVAATGTPLAKEKLRLQ